MQNAEKSLGLAVEQNRRNFADLCPNSQKIGLKAKNAPEYRVHDENRVGYSPDRFFQRSSKKVPERVLSEAFLVVEATLAVALAIKMPKSITRKPATPNGGICVIAAKTRIEMPITEINTPATILAGEFAPDWPARSILAFDFLANEASSA